MIDTTPLRKKLLDLAFSGKLVTGHQPYEEVLLSSVCVFINGDRGNNYPAKKTLTATGDIPFISAVNLEDGTVRCDNLLYLSRSRYNALRAGKLLKGDVVLCIRGSLGKYCIYPFDVGAIASSLVILRCCDSISNKYLAAFIESTCFKKQIRAYDNGTAQPNLAAKDVMRFRIPLPPLSEQRAIVSRLEELLALEREIAADSAALDDLIAAAKRKILDLAVAGKLVKKQGEWRMLKGSEIFLDTESRLPKGEYFDYIDIDAIDNKRYRIVAPKHIAVKDAPSRASRGVRTGDTLFSIVRPYLENIAYVEGEFSDCIASTGFFVCRPISNCDSRYLYRMMTSPSIVGGLNRFMKGDNSPSIRKGDIMSFDFPLPSLAEQRAIVAKVDELFAVLDAMKD